MSLQKEWEGCLQQQPQLPFPDEKQNTKLAQLLEKKKKPKPAQETRRTNIREHRNVMP